VIVDHLSFLISVCTLLTVISGLWLLFMIFLPRQWSSLVDKENACWVGKKIISPARAEQIKRLEKGLTAKLMAISMMILSIIVLGVSLHYWSLINPQHRKPALPAFQPRVTPTNGHRTQL
jgi:hypothetical protein